MGFNSGFKGLKPVFFMACILVIPYFSLHFTSQVNNAMI